MKELAVYFKKRMKDQDTIPKLWTDRNYGEDIDYNVDHEIENRKSKLSGFLNNLERNKKFKLKVFENGDDDTNSGNSVNDQQIKFVENELKLLKVYNLQKKLRRDIVVNFVNEFDKHNTVYYSDFLFQKTLLDRRFYKKQTQNILTKRENRLSDKFEQQLRIGIDFRKRDKHLEFLNSLMQHHKEFMEFHKSKKVIIKKLLKIRNKFFYTFIFKEIIL